MDRTNDYYRNKLWLTPKEVATVMGKRRETIISWVKKGLIPGVRRIRGCYFIPRRWVEPVLDLDDEE